MHLAIVTHCWNYARLASYQISSLLLYPPPVGLRVTYWFMYTTADERTSSLVEWAWTQLADQSRLKFWPQALAPEMLCRRAIGRNLAARGSDADWLWFADADYIFGPGCLAALPAQLAMVTGPLAHPGQLLISTDHARGDRYINQVTDWQPRRVDPADFIAKGLGKAIGGAQIARGEACRTKGYCDQPRLQRPARHWVPTKDDVWFRLILNSSGQKIDLPHLYRLRHSRRGQDEPGVIL